MRMGSLPSRTGPTYGGAADMTDPGARYRHGEARLRALADWAESDEREVHPDRGESGEASQTIAREMLLRADADGP